MTPLQTSATRVFKLYVAFAALLTLELKQTEPKPGLQHATPAAA